MKFTIERNELLSGLYLTQGIVEKRSTIPILSNLLIRAEESGVLVAASDQEVEVRRRCSAKVEKTGAVTTPARKLYEMIREFPEGELAVSALDNKWIEVQARRSRFRLVGLDPADFPALQEPPSAESEWLRAQAKVIEEMIERTIFAVSTDESRPTLNGVCLERPAENQLRMVATDGHRLAMVTRAVEGDGLGKRCVIPRKALMELRRVLESAEEELLLAQAGGRVHARSGPVDLSMSLVAGEFPRYEEVIPTSVRHQVEADVGELRAAIRRVAIVSSEKNRGVRIDIRPGRIELSSINPEVGEAAEELDVKYDGPPVRIGFNSRYLQEALQVMPDDSPVRLGVNDESSPGVLVQPDDPDYSYIVMPMRL